MDRPRRGRLLGLTMLAASVIATGTIARAQPHDPALAQALFDEATKLYEEGLKSHDNAKLAEACAKFEASHRTDPGYGAAFNLATCDETIGKTASAWAAFLEAAALAKTQGDAADAKQRADAIAPKLVRLKITVAPPNENVVIKRDGAVQDRAAWGTNVPVDPGSHPITADAPGKQSWSTTAVVEGEGKVVLVEVPTLQNSTPAASSSTSDAPRPFGAQRGAALGVGGLGVLGLVIGGALAGTAKSKWDEAKPHCDEQHRCDPFGLSTGREARALADGATVPFVVGGVALAAGVVLWLTAPASAPAKPPPPSATAHAWIGRDGGGLVVRGAF